MRFFERDGYVLLEMTKDEASTLFARCLECDDALQSVCIPDEDYVLWDQLRDLLAVTVNRIHPSQIILKMTCAGCPEQYDAFYGNRQVGYLRLRHGYFSVRYPGAGGVEVYGTGEVRSDGNFEDSERDRYLLTAKMAIIRELYGVKNSR